MSSGTRRPSGAAHTEASSPARRAYLAGLRRNLLAVWALRVGIVVVSLALWEIAGRRGWINTFIASDPSKIGAQIVELYREGTLWTHFFTTVAETIVGFVCGTILGVVIAMGLWWSRFWARVLEPFIVILNAIPKVALGPIFIIWIGTNIRAVIAMAVAISVLVTIMMVFSGFQSVDENYIRLLRSFDATRGQILRKVVLPASVPTILAALKVNVGLSLVGTIVGEFLVAKEGLGYLIVYGGQIFNLSLVMAAVTLLLVASAGLYYLVAAIERKLLAGRE